MKKIIFSAITMAAVLVSCNQKNNENSTNNSMMEEKDSTLMNNKTKMMENSTKMYACPMHPEVQGNMDDKCSKCGMKLTEPVSEKAEENKK